jgi:hypothetical protein
MTIFVRPSPLKSPALGRLNTSCTWTADSKVALKNVRHSQLSGSAKPRSVWVGSLKNADEHW